MPEPTEVFARLIKAKYDESPADRYPQEEPLAEFILAGLKAAGYAVVELPTAIPDEYQGEIWRVELSDWTPGEVYLRNSDQRIGVTGVPFVLGTPRDARTLAAALLSAADAAESSNA